MQGVLDLVIFRVKYDILVNKKPFDDTTLKGIVHKIISYHESRIGDNA